jgi:hypothetical protein
MPFTAAGRSERAVAALLEQAPHAELVDVSAGPTSYHDLWRDLWHAGEDFAMVEHDVILAPGTIAALDACPWPWCSVPAEHGWMSTTTAGWGAAALCCNRWRAQVLTANPDVLDLPLLLRHWSRLDAAVLPWIVADVHVHWTTPTEHRRPTFAAMTERDSITLAWWKLHGTPAEVELMTGKLAHVKLERESWERAGVAAVDVERRRAR